jgi:hypothetical protein
MPIIEIHGKQVHVPEGSNSAKHAVNFLNEHPNDAKAFFEAAHHDHVNGVAHFDTNRPAGYHGSTDFTIIHNKNDGSYELRKKEHHMF